MKKASVFLICLSILCVFLCSCGSRQGGELTESTQGQSGKTETSAVKGTAPFDETETSGVADKPSAPPETVKKAPETEPSAPSSEKLRVKYIRDYPEDYDTPAKAMIISSADVLKALYGSSIEELAKLCEEYTEEYFKTGVLLIVNLVESSGSVTHEVTGVDNNNGELCVNIKTHRPEVGTCDMAAWQIVVEYPQGEYSGINVKKS